jgi:hypothetical protein
MVIESPHYGQIFDVQGQRLCMLKLLFGLFLVPLHLLGQVFPVDDQSGKITYSEDILVKDAAQSELFDRAKVWINRTALTDKAILKEDTCNGLITGKAYFPLVLEEGGKQQRYRIWYTAVFRVEDDRYWYRLTEFQLQENHLPPLAPANGAQAPKQPLEKFVMPKKAEKENRVHKAIASQADESIRALLAEMSACLLGTSDRR